MVSIKISRQSKKKVQSTGMTVGQFLVEQELFGEVSQTSIDEVSDSGMGVINLIDPATGQYVETNIRVYPKAMDALRTGELDPETDHLKLELGYRRVEGEETDRLYAALPGTFAKVGKVADAETTKKVFAQYKKLATANPIKAEAVKAGFNPEKFLALNAK
jgi:hypothetical protein